MPFRALSSKLQNRVEDCNLIFYIIDSKVPERARLDIFERVNSGEPLTRQQMRNSLFMGKGTRFLKAESRTEVFSTRRGRSLNVKNASFWDVMSTGLSRYAPDRVAARAEPLRTAVHRLLQDEAFNTAITYGPE